MYRVSASNRLTEGRPVSGGGSCAISYLMPGAIASRADRASGTPDTIVCRAASPNARSEEHTSELQSLMRISYAVFCLKKKETNTHNYNNDNVTNNTVKHTR